MSAPLGTIHELLVRQADALGAAPAIVAPDRRPLGYVALLAEVDPTVVLVPGFRSAVGMRSRASPSQRFSQ